MMMMMMMMMIIIINNNNENKKVISNVWKIVARSQFWGLVRILRSCHCRLCVFLSFKVDFCTLCILKIGR